MSRQAALGGKYLHIFGGFFWVVKLQTHFLKLLRTLLIPPSKVTQLADTLSYTNTRPDTQMQKKNALVQGLLCRQDWHSLSRTRYREMSLSLCFNLMCVIKKGGLPQKVASKFFTAGFTLQGTRQSRAQILSGGFKK